MRTFLKNSAIVLAIAGATLAMAASAGADGLVIGIGSGNQHGAAISVAFGDVAFGYRDGYWDNGHRWHRWNNDRDYRNYRDHHAGNYRDWNHDRDGGDGWQQGGDRNTYGDRSRDGDQRH